MTDRRILAVSIGQVEKAARTTHEIAAALRMLADRLHAEEEQLAELRTLDADACEHYSVQAHDLARRMESHARDLDHLARYLARVDDDDPDTSRGDGSGA
jgi:acyl-CoA reductase-like NAD-dependent aldehyde dehydrogenase